MLLSEKHIVKKNNKEFKKLDHFCFLSKNLYNTALYTLKKHYGETGKHLNYNAIEKLFRINKHLDYISLPPNTSQQILMLVDKNYRSFFSSITSYKKSKNKFKGLPSPPKYKHKTKGRNLLVFTTNQAKLKNGFIKFPKRIGIQPFKTNVDNLKQVRIVPQTGCYVIEVIYEKKENVHENLDKTKYLSIDLGLNNLATVVSNQPGCKPTLISGRVLKSINQYYNKKRAILQSKLPHNQHSSNKINTLTLKRNNKIKNYMHHCSKYIIQHALQYNIGNIVIGYNEQWKQYINIGKRNNQNFVGIPFLIFINQIKYKAQLEGINVILHEESYTSKCSAFDLEEICKHDRYVGRRVKRGLFKTSLGYYVNADVNAAINILRKVTNDLFLKEITVSRGLVVSPVSIMINTNSYKCIFNR